MLKLDTLTSTSTRLNAERDSIKAICFDLDGTLYNQTKFRARMAFLLLWRWLTGGIKLEQLRLLQSFRENKELARKLGIVPQIDTYILEMTAREKGCTVREVVHTVEQWMYRAPLPILSGFSNLRLRQMLNRLRLRGYRLAVFSDYPVREKLAALELPLTLFDTLVEAGEPEVSALKPHRSGFLEVCRRLQLTPTEILYVGDRPSVDGKGALSVGMQFARYKPYSFLPRRDGCLGSLLELEDRLDTCRTTSFSRNQGGCWLCGGSLHSEFFPSKLPEEITPDMVKITDSRYGVAARLVQCCDCGFIHAERETARDLEFLYQGMVDTEYQESSMARRQTFLNLLRTIRKHRPNATSLLDIGASTGFFCAEAQRAGFRVEGVEPSAWAVTEGRKQHGIVLHEGYFPHPNIEGRQFDVVTMFDVIEHVSRPVEILQAVHRNVSKDGLVVLVTPDIGSFVAKTMGAYWWHIRPAHVGYFSRKTVQAALGAAGFAIEKIEPYRWCLPLGYLVDRLRSYSPFRRLRGCTMKLGKTEKWTSQIWRRNIPINMRDSYVYFAKPEEVE